jgi:5'(3')-deoxyribonucleotidase
MATVAIDFDETLFSTNREWFWRFYQRTGYGIDFDRCDWDCSGFFPESLRDEFYATRNADMYLHGNIFPYEDAIEMVKGLERRGHRIVVVSRDTVENATAKRTLLHRFFPRLADSLVIAQNKHKSVRFDFLVDDYPLSGADWYPARPWNTAVPFRRIEDMSIIPLLVDTVTDQRRRRDV